METTKTHFKLEKGEYLIGSEHPSSRHYEVFLKGKKLNDVVAVVRMTVEE